MKKKLKSWLPSRRRLMQLYFALLFNANLKGFVSGNIYQGASKKVCVPGINCYSCPGAVGACPLGSLQGSYSADRSTLFYVGGILLLYALMLGRMICGWLCPFGLVQDLTYLVKTPKVKKGVVTRLLSWVKYVILVFFVVIVPVMYAFRDTPLPAFCKYICPAGTFEGGIGLLSNAVNESYFSMLGPLFTWKFLLMVSILVGCVFIYRLFCRFICPLGAFYGLFNKLSFFGVKVDESKCTDCGLCVAHCKVDIKKVGDRECIGCGDCVDVCPTKAITWKGPKILLRANEAEPEKRKKARLTTRIIVGVLMLALLGGAITYYWVTAPETVKVIAPEEYGNTEGKYCYGYTLPVVTKDGVTEQTLDPSTTGKVTVINFWGTWCTPCVQELPHFEAIAEEYADQVVVIAIHSAMSSETGPDYIAEHYPDSKLVFSQDTGSGFTGEYYTMLGGRGSYPYTLVLNAEGVITKVFWSSVTHEDLQAAVQQALES